MSTYTQDITHLIGKINTSLPDNDTQAITAARIRDAMGAVAYNYDLYVLKTQLSQELGSYVLKTDLDTAGYVTASALSGYATQDDLQTGMQSVLDDAYAYVVEKINEIPGVDLSAYVTKDELSAAGYLTAVPSEYITDTELYGMGYITSSDLPDMSTYATKTYVADYVATHTGPVDLSAYVTKDELSAAGYLTAVPSEYITDTELSNVLSTASYVTQQALSGMGYLTAVPSEYVTESQLQSTLTAYITETELSAAGYITSSYAATYYLDYTTFGDYTSAMQDTLINANILITDPETGDWTTQTMASETYVADYVASYAPTPDLSTYVTKDELSAAGYLTAVPSEYVTESQLQSTLTAYITDTELSGMGYITSSDLPDMSAYVTKTDLSNAGYLTSIPSTYATYDAISAMGYITSSDLPDMSAYATITYVETYYATNTALGNKQDTLVSGTNIKTINNESLLGSGNIDIQSGAEPDYSRVLTFTAEQANSTIKLQRVGSSSSLTNVTLQYSTDGGETWTNYTLGQSKTLSTIGNTIKFKGTNTTLAYDYNNYHQFIMTGKIKASGDVTSLINEVGGEASLNNYCFVYLFNNCSALSTAPILPNTTLATSCYARMFYGCTSLTQAPELPAMTLADNCYNQMFYGCTSLTKAPKLPAMIMTLGCYNSMFRSCTSLTEAPELPSTTLANFCYRLMFDGCTSLKKAPVLPTVNLTNSNCYGEMFQNCSNLKYVKAMFTTTPSNTYTQNWLSNVSSTGTFVKSNDATWTTTGTNAVPSGWTEYKTVALDTDDVPESYVEDNGKGLQVVNGAWQKVSGLLTSANLIYDSTTNTLTINV